MKNRPSLSGGARLTCIGLTCVALVQMSGCTLGPNFVRPAEPDASHFSRGDAVSKTATADGLAQTFSSDISLPANWWQLFQSERLNDVVQQALAHNQTLAAAQASLRQSQDYLQAGSGVFYPQVNATLGAERVQNAPLQQGSTANAVIYNVVSLSGTVSYALDLFGGNRRMVEALGAQVDNQRYLTRAAYLALSSNVVDTVIARAAYEAQIAAVRQLIALETEQLHSAEIQVQAGTLPYSNVLSLRAQIASNEAQLAPLRQRAGQAKDLLASLEGVSPAKVVLPTVALADLKLPENLPLSLPSQLVRQRPDILSAEAQLHAASANIGVTAAAMYPNFSLSASYGSAGNPAGNITGNGEQFWSAGTSITAPIFNAASLSAQHQAALDAYAAQQASYRQTVLNAFAQVADVLKALKHDAQALQAQDEVQRAALEALMLLQTNYKAGMVAYVDVQSAEVQYQQARVGYFQAVAQRHQDTVALFAALGGGWWNAPEAAEGAAQKTGAP